MYSNKRHYLFYLIVLFRNPAIKCDKQILPFCLGLHMLDCLGDSAEFWTFWEYFSLEQQQEWRWHWKSPIFKRQWMWEKRGTVALGITAGDSGYLGLHLTLPLCCWCPGLLGVILKNTVLRIPVFTPLQVCVVLSCTCNILRKTWNKPCYKINVILSKVWYISHLFVVLKSSTSVLCHWLKSRVSWLLQLSLTQCCGLTNATTLWHQLQDFGRESMLWNQF